MMWSVADYPLAPSPSVMPKAEVEVEVEVEVDAGEMQSSGTVHLGSLARHCYRLRLLPEYFFIMKH